MEKYISLALFLILMISCCIIPVGAVEENVIPRAGDFSFVSPTFEAEDTTDNSRATGLISNYDIVLSKTGTTLNIYAKTFCIPEVVKCGFKNFVVERKKASSSIWSEYYDYGDLYIDSYTASYRTTLVVESGYQYRISCKHYAKKSLLITQNISNTSNVVSV